MAQMAEEEGGWSECVYMLEEEMLQRGKEELKDLLVSSEAEDNCSLRDSVQLCGINDFSYINNHYYCIKISYNYI